MVASGEGVQVLFVEEEGQYRCDEGALRRVAGAGGGAARGLPVAVVSVAGATRGGKSFLLDFFLRYLRASEAERRSGAWLGADDEPLTGFNWRGGCERHTEGILVWSEPIIITLGAEKKNEKVAVVLLDTQGAFDSSSTMRDSTTVFALSTLLSSVQIYNLSQNIKEDDLHYLQLFTEYGKLAREEDVEKPFQELRFLVRDWCFAYDHAFGTEGGQQLINKRLEMRDGQANELREIRAHIRGAFEHVHGFLMPHPGLTVAANPTFRGCLKDISSEFKDALLELVPSLFAPENLVIKHVNGQKLTLQDFAEYFKTYVEVFNSDTLPTPTTVLQATSAASLEAALNACRGEYVSRMEGDGAACVPRGALPARHAAALLAARQSFAARRTLAAPALAAARLDALLQELDASLADYEARNNGRILDAAARCKAMYEAAMETTACLTNEELTEMHNSVVTLAKTAFHAEFAAKPVKTEGQGDNSKEHNDKIEEHGNSELGSGEEVNNSEVQDNSGELEDNAEELEVNSEEFEENEDWKILAKELSDLLPLQRERNAARISAALEAAKELYMKHMEKALESAQCLHPLSLQTHKTTAGNVAEEHFLNSWLHPLTVPDQEKTQLRAYMRQKYKEFVALNDTNNQRAIEQSSGVYTNIMSQICSGVGGRCLHPQDLTTEHEAAEKAAVEDFQRRRDSTSPRLSDTHTRKLHQVLFSHHMKFGEINESRNQAAVKVAHEFYEQLIAPLRSSAAVFNRHPQIKRNAIDMFQVKRRQYGRIYPTDAHLEDLDKKIESSYGWIKVRFATEIATTVAGALAMGGLLFGRK